MNSNLVNNEYDLLIRISRLKDGDRLCHSSDKEYSRILCLCRSLKAKGLITYRKPSAGIYTASSKLFCRKKEGFLSARLTYDGLKEVNRIRDEKRRTYISVVSLGISLAALLVPLVCKYFPVLSKYIRSLIGH